MIPLLVLVFAGVLIFALPIVIYWRKLDDKLLAVMEPLFRKITRQT